jgi:hypothetical protein
MEGSCDHGLFLKWIFDVTHVKINHKEAQWRLKVKLSLCLINSLRHESVWGSGWPRPLYPPGTHWIGGWVGPKTGLNDVEKRNISPLPGLKLQPPWPSSPYPVSVPTSLSLLLGPVKISFRILFTWRRTLDQCPKRSGLNKDGRRTKSDIIALNKKIRHEGVKLQVQAVVYCGITVYQLNYSSVLILRWKL